MDEDEERLERELACSRGEEEIQRLARMSRLGIWDVEVRFDLNHGFEQYGESARSSKQKHVVVNEDKRAEQSYT